MEEGAGRKVTVFDFPALEAALRNRLQGPRLDHVLRVTDTAIELSAVHEVSTDRARAAALLHDYARNLPDQVLLRLGQDFGLVTDESEEENPGALLHAPVGAVLVEREGLVTDPEVLLAIKYHTTGVPGMSRLAQLIWAADMVEPGRNYPGVEVQRRLAWIDLDQAVLAGLDHTIAYLIAHGYRIHPIALATRNWLLGKVELSGNPWRGYRLPG